MAVYTIELDTLIKSGYDIGLTDYPLPSYLITEDDKARFRDALNKKIIAHYRFDEICCIPPDRFKHFLNTTMNEIMPVKNLLYDALAENWKFYTGSSFTEAINDSKSDTHDGEHTGIDTLAKTGNDKRAKSGDDKLAKSGNDKLVKTGSDTNTENAENSSSNNGYVLNVGSDTPGQMLNIETDIANNTYASNANKNKSTGSSTGTATSTDTITYNSTDTTTYNSTNTTTYNSTDTTTYNSTDTTTYNTKTKDENAGTYERQRTVTGLNGKSYAELFKEYQGSLRNIDTEVIKALSECFMSIY